MELRGLRDYARGLGGDRIVENLDVRERDEMRF